MQNETYNYYLTRGVLDGSIKEVLRDGVRTYLVRRPLSGEEVIGFINFSSFLAEPTPTGVAGSVDV